MIKTDDRLPALEPLTREHVATVHDLAAKVYRLLEALPYRDAVEAMGHMNELLTTVDECLPGYEFHSRCESCDTPMGINEAEAAGDVYLCPVCMKEAMDEYQRTEQTEKTDDRTE